MPLLDATSRSSGLSNTGSDSSQLTIKSSAEKHKYLIKRNGEP